MLKTCLILLSLIAGPFVSAQKLFVSFDPKSGAFGLKGTDSSWIISPDYSYIRKIPHGFIADEQKAVLPKLRIFHKTRFIDSTGAMTPWYDLIDFTASHSEAYIVTTGGKLSGYKWNGGKKGLVFRCKEVISPRFDYISFPDKNGYMLTAIGGREEQYKVATGHQYYINKNVWIKGKYGMISHDGRILQENTYDYIHTEHKQFGWHQTFNEVNIGGKWINDWARGWVVQGGKWGIMNENYALRIPVQYDFIKQSHDNRFLINNGGRFLVTTIHGGKYGYVDSLGKTVIPPVYSSISSYRGNVALATKDSGLHYPDDDEPGKSNYGLIDWDGNELTTFDHSHMMFWDQGLIKASKAQGKDTLWGIIDNKGKTVLEIKYIFIESKHYTSRRGERLLANIILGRNSSGKTSYELVKASNYERIGKGDFKKMVRLRRGYLGVAKDSLLALMDSSGSLLTDYKYSGISRIQYNANKPADSIFFLVEGTQGFNYLRADGSEILKDWIKKSDYIPYSLYSIVRSSDKWGLRNFHGDTVLKPIYFWTTDVEKELRPIPVEDITISNIKKKREPRGVVFVNVGGTLEKDRIKGGKWGAVHLVRGIEVVKPTYDQLSWFYKKNAWGEPKPRIRYRDGLFIGVLDEY